MIAQVKTVNGTKTLVPLTTDTGQGLPLGAITAFYGTNVPNGYLLCDGSTFDANVYPALYSFLGSNVLPDLRECVLVGVGTNNSDSITTHDVYTLGCFKDDQLQCHCHTVPLWRYSGSDNSISTYCSTNYWKAVTSSQACGARTGTTTHGKQKGVNYIIKAIIGPIENSAADQVVTYVNTERSYSTEEVDTGKTWIDGCPIYRLVTPVISCTIPFNSTTVVANLNCYTSCVNEVIEAKEVKYHDGYFFNGEGYLTGSCCNGTIVYVYQNYAGGCSVPTCYRYIFEYTKCE